MLSDSQIQQFRSSLRGQVLTSTDHAYDEARQIFNAMIDRRPALIARCAGASDVISSVRFAQEHDLTVSVRGGGHGIAGNAVCEDGLMIDLSLMRTVRVDPRRRTARADAGVTLADFDHETQAFQLATTLGTFSPTGIAGLTLGGGFGWLMGRYGLACDNLISVDIVTADADLLTASDSENADLFWALRGGGGNFGVVTSFEYQLHHVGPVFAGLVVYPMSQSGELLRFLREFAPNSPDELGLMPAMLTLPDGTDVIGVAACYCGALEAGEQALKPLRSFGSPLTDVFRPMSYAKVQQMLDWWASPPRRHHYWKSGFLPRLSDGAVDTVVHFAMKKPSRFAGVGLEYLHGAAARVPPDATAFPHRAISYNFLMLGSWETPAETEANMRWVREFWEAMKPFLSSATYVNYLSEGEGDQRVRNSYGSNYDRLASLKRRYDPQNFFRMNQNIQAVKRAA